jgi:hypothetical protein
MRMMIPAGPLPISSRTISVLSCFDLKNITFGGPPTKEELHGYLLGEAKRVLQEGFFSPQVLAVFGDRAEIYTMPPNMGQDNLDAALEVFKVHVMSKKADKAAYVYEGFIRSTPKTDPYYDQVQAGCDISKLPGTIRMLEMTIQDPLRYWQYVYEISVLPDGTRFPGQLILGQDPAIPAQGFCKVQNLFFGPPPGYRSQQN